MKPGILIGNLITFGAGFWLASGGHFDGTLFFMSLFGLAGVIGSACIFNNYIDRALDGKMGRTKKRALVKGTISPAVALVMAAFLGICGNLLLIGGTNILTVFLANLGFAIYIGLYSLLKTKTVYATFIGSLSGAIPPVVGYTSVSQSLDSGAWMLFFLMLFWQMPHFFAIALYRYEDYKRAQVPVLPLSKGVTRTKIEMSLYILLLFPVLIFLTKNGYTGTLFLYVTATLTFLWFALSLKGFVTSQTTLWGKQMFRFSLVLINAICFLIFLS